MTKQPTENEKSGRRRAYKISVKRAKITGIMFLVVVAVAIFLMSPIFSIDSIVINKTGGNSESVIKELGFKKGDNIFSIDIAAARKRVEKLDRVESCEIKRTLPGKVTVTVDEKTESGYIKISSGFAGIDENGKVMKICKTKEKEAPQIKGIKIYDPQKNDYIKAKEKNGKEKTETVIRVLTSLKEQDIVHMVKTVDVSSEKNISLVLTSDTVVNFGRDGKDNDDKLEYKIAFLKAILQEDKLKGGTIELSDTSNVTARMS